jgi:hypothetical protein
MAMAFLEKQGDRYVVCYKEKTRGQKKQGDRYVVC